MVSLDPLECAVIEIGDQLSGEGEPVTTDSLLDAVADRYGFAPNDVYRRIVDLANPQVTGLRLIDFIGNHGDLDHGPADARYTALSVTALGRAAVAVRAVGAAAGLVHGDMHKGGRRPPLAPAAVAAAFSALEEGRSPAEVADLLGPPAFPTGCRVSGEIDRLARGDQVRLRLSAQLETKRLDGGMTEIEISRPPFGVGPQKIMGAILDFTESPDGRRSVSDVIDDSRGGRPLVRVVCRPSAAVADLVTELASRWFIHIYLDARHKEPLDEVLEMYRRTPELSQANGVLREHLPS